MSRKGALVKPESSTAVLGTAALRAGDEELAAAADRMLFSIHSLALHPNACGGALIPGGVGRSTQRL